MFSILGISGNDYDFKYFKTSIYLNPIDYSEKIRVIIKVSFGITQSNFSNPIYIHLDSNRKIIIEDLQDKSEKINDIAYSEGIGSSKLTKKSVPLKIESISQKSGINNKISIKILPEYDEMNKIIEMEQEKLRDITEIKFSFMISAIIKNEGVEIEPLWRRLLGLSQFAWRFHIKIWSMAEDFEPLENLSMNPVQYTQVFLIILKNFINSYGEIVSHPGEETLHTMTIRDRNIFLQSEKSEELKKRIEKWFEKGAKAFSWEYGHTSTMSREMVVEHNPPSFLSWTPLTVTTILFTFVTILLQVFPLFSQQFKYFWVALPILFILSYFYTNLKRFSFYELKKEKKLAFLIMFLRISISILFIFLISLLIPRDFFQRLKFIDFILFTFLILIMGILLNYIIKNERIKISYNFYIKVKKFPYKLKKNLCSIILAFITIIFIIILFNFKISLFFPVSSAVYIVVVLWKALEN